MSVIRQKSTCFRPFKRSPLSPYVSSVIIGNTGERDTLSATSATMNVGWVERSDTHRFGVPERPR